MSPWNTVRFVIHHIPLRASLSFSSRESFVEQAVVYSTFTTGLSTLTFRGEVVVDGGGVEGRSEVIY